MTSHKFKQELKQEAEQWRIEGLINQNIYEALAQRYQFTNLATNSNNRFTAVVITFGCILLGLAVITFVAANWQVWSKSIKVAILISFFLITNVAGFYIWQKATENWQSRLGQGLLLLGSLILGANIGLMSQMFHQTGAVYQLYLVWGCGVLLMAYGLGLTSLGIVAIILISIGYFSSMGFFPRGELSHIIQLIPLLVSCLFIPLAYRCRSAWLFFLASCLTIASFNINFLYDIDTFIQPLRGFLFAIAFLIPLAFFWSYQDRPKLLNFSTPISFASLSRKIAVCDLSIFLYLASFNWWWDYYPTSQASFQGNWYYSILCIHTLVFTIISIYWWWKLGQRRNNNTRWRLDNQSIYMAIAITTSSLLLWLNFNNNPVGYLGTIIFNLFLFSLAFILIRQALKSAKRLGYWSGIILLSLQVLSRMFEYNTGLLTKAVVLFICGLGVIFAGIWFEKNLTQSQV
ncbi:conserved membrane hypothetical protein [Hyella patelloides LEGE 07179]|uniref:DUF2157 domain-containing protein n=1 Tax=Hyella patelloides LEGE 07179 TaxID=945734 RepID=A0A563VUG1_9CYAN|nr:DUF2157 domain-containing protein [Hyella patelloides]VEP15077.1 conserved membrane hypothetical protein [Hyella patelloides LEGE 07179]